MFESANSRRNALVMSIGWWYLRRFIRKRGTAAVAGYLAGEGLSFAASRGKRRPLRWLLLVLGVAGAGGYYWWTRQGRGGGDDWDDWTPAEPVSPTPAEPAPEPEPVGA